MKIAVASEGKTQNSDVSEKGGRAPYYLIFEKDEIVECLKNPFAMGGGGAGFGVAKMLADKGVDKVIAGKFGSNMETALEERGLVHKEAKGKIIDALKLV